MQKIIQARRIDRMDIVQPGAEPFIEVAYEEYEATDPPLPVFFGADPLVESMSLPLEGYHLPQPSGERARLEDFGGERRPDFDNGPALDRAIARLNPSGIIDVSGVMYGIKNVHRFHNVEGISIVGNGPGSGFMAMQNDFDSGRGRWGCIIEYWGAKDCQFRDFEFDLNSQPIGALYHKDDERTVFARVKVHSGGGGPTDRTMPLAMIKGSGKSSGLMMVGIIVENSAGNARPGVSGVRGYWGPHDQLNNALISNCIFRMCGHTGLAVNPHGGVTIENVTSKDNKGAGIKTDKPENMTGAAVDPCDIVAADCKGNGFWSWQIEMRTKVSKSRSVGGKAAWTAHDEGNFGKEVSDCLILECSEAGIWNHHRDPGQGNDNWPFGDLVFRNNTITGNLARGGIVFEGRYTRPRGDIVIVENKTNAGVPVKTTRQIEEHAGTTIENNGPNGAGPRA